ncbi:hypothetical protein AB1Y20_016826 [Prymnesium parvum]|uniref:Uncharacterized protein n=1 Tax=Prymnesium parvum TaxID=97485 RepID=A0AB34I960_PRYPA
MLVGLRQEELSGEQTQVAAGFHASSSPTPLLLAVVKNNSDTSVLVRVGVQGTNRASEYELERNSNLYLCPQFPAGVKPTTGALSLIARVHITVFFKLGPEWRVYQILGNQARTIYSLPEADARRREADDGRRLPPTFDCAKNQMLRCIGKVLREDDPAIYAVICLPQLGTASTELWQVVQATEGERIEVKYVGSMYKLLISRARWVLVWVSLYRRVVEERAYRPGGRGFDDVRTQFYELARGRSHGGDAEDDICTTFRQPDDDRKACILQPDHAARPLGVRQPDDDRRRRILQPDHATRPLGVHQPDDDRRPCILQPDHATQPHPPHQPDGDRPVCILQSDHTARDLSRCTNLTTIGNGAFCNLTTPPDLTHCNLTTIGDYAFSNLTTPPDLSGCRHERASLAKMLQATPPLRTNIVVALYHLPGVFNHPSDELGVWALRAPAPPAPEPEPAPDDKEEVEYVKAPKAKKKPAKKRIIVVQESSSSEEEEIEVRMPRKKKQEQSRPRVPQEPEVDERLLKSYNQLFSM